MSLAVFWAVLIFKILKLEISYDVNMFCLFTPFPSKISYDHWPKANNNHFFSYEEETEKIVLKIYY